MTRADRACPGCGEPTIDGANFCEACGRDLTGASGGGCADCAAPARAIDDDGYCTRCGHKQPAPGDHAEQDDGDLVAVTDRGRRHHRNEDAFSIARVDGAVVLVVCDGVSTTSNPHEAAKAAADATSSSLVDALTNGTRDVRAALTEAVHAAQDAVLEVPAGNGAAPSCTIVASVAQPGADGGVTVTTGWLGDSRAYWVGAEASATLTVDHSWATEMVEAGATETEAMADPRAHTITRWLGRDAVDLDPSIAVHEMATPGRLVVCSDGLWNYAPSGPDMGALVTERAGDGVTPIELARELVTFALDAGGHDNITVAAATYPDSPPMEPEHP